MGFPIRKSPDQSLLSSFPRLIAADHVLHRHLTPRHPPFALTSLTKTVDAKTQKGFRTSCFGFLGITQRRSLYGTQTIQLSKTERIETASMGRITPTAKKNLVELIGIEPTTSGLQSPRSPS